MKVIIDTAILQKYGLSLEEFILMFLGTQDFKLEECLKNLIKRGFAGRNLYNPFIPVLSEEQKNIVADIMLESNPLVCNAGLDFDELALAMQERYPNGNKAGTTYSWRGETKEIARKLRTVVAKYNFLFTSEEALQAVDTYTSEFPTIEDKRHMSLLKNFILKTCRDSEGFTDINSQFMSCIESNREKRKENENLN